MTKQYLVSLAQDQGAQAVEAIKTELNNLNIKMVDELGEVNVLVVKIPDHETLQKARAIKGVAAVEEDQEMRTL
ncbi:hypothetical protein A3860_11190 [Niastella vici]|uniref:ACT domain-containing protein n=1 Tax=Niastella vici TaxID=1703345 RepID=A0A1V9FFS6_9BACT|nr:hypothetical protein [Niastella vici]OQP57121.1 hypothetical protein A3860_11190 [Niastella vici]